MMHRYKAQEATLMMQPRIRTNERRVNTNSAQANEASMDESCFGGWSGWWDGGAACSSNTSSAEGS